MQHLRHDTYRHRLDAEQCFRQIGRTFQTTTFSPLLAARIAAWPTFVDLALS